jgi:hypothetical protein
MEAPLPNPLPPPPRVPQRFGRTILVIVLAPMVLLGLGMAVAGGLQLKGSDSYFWLVFLAGCICSILGAAYICVVLTKVLIARILIFAVAAVGLIVVYTVCICAGCGAVNGPMNFH